MYFDIGIGLQDLNRTKNDGFLNAAAQQSNWHKSNNYKPINNNPTTNLNGGMAEGIAMTLELVIGKALTETFIKNKWINCSGDVDLNAFGVFSGNKGASYLGGQSNNEV